MRRTRTGFQLRETAAALSLVLSVAALHGCSAASENECPAGSEGCACLGNGACDGELTCDALGRCVLDACPAGSEGCACANDGSCGRNAMGEVLACVNDLCVAPSCVPGDSGCVCVRGTTCSGADDECIDGFCSPAACIPGELDCACAGGGCGPGLSCREDVVCVDNSGRAGGPCFRDDTCFAGNRCQGDVCVPCNAGTRDCVCAPGNFCGGGLICNAGQCSVYDGPPVPVKARCYTPCSQGLVRDDGSYLACPADGLMPGCINGLSCVEGTCTEPGGAPATCIDAFDCPSFQTCILGQCYSNCENDSECSGGLSCLAHVCRKPCSTSADTCGEGNACVSDDGELGHCLPVAAPTGEPTREVEGSFSLSKVALELSNVHTNERFRLTNNGPAFERFRVRKLNHVAYLEDGNIERRSDPDDDVACTPNLGDCPLFWLGLGEADATARVQEIEVGLDSGADVIIEITAAGDFTAPRWEGHLEVTHPRLGTQTVTLTYSERPEGRWAGNVYYFAQFGDYKLQEWLDDPQATPATQVGNAFVQRWVTFRSGNISWEEFQAVIMATRTESWRWPNVVEDCPAAQAGANGACYMFDINELGLVEYTEDNASIPIPTGVTEMPFAANLYQPDPAGDPGAMSGRIESNQALQYAGNPALTVRFENNPSQCDTTVGGACLSFLEQFDADVVVGGRYTTIGADAACSERTGAGYRLEQTPWLVPGFECATELDPATGQRYRFECRDGQLPFGDGSEPLTEVLQAQNSSLAASNPIPDGRTRCRAIRLVDGALINQSTMFLIFRESFASFLPGDADRFSAYGFMILERQAADLDSTDADADGTPDAYQGNILADTRSEPTDVLGVACSPELVATILGWNHTTIDDGSEADRMVLGLIDGIVSDEDPQYIGAGSAEAVHYLCGDTGLFDGGPGAVTDIYSGALPPNDDLCGFAPDADNFDADNFDADNFYDSNGSCDDGGPGADTSICPLGTDVTDCGDRVAGDADTRVPCPAGSEVIFFTVESAFTQTDVAELACQENGSCRKTLDDWLATGGPLVQLQPSYRCEQDGQVYCDADRYDLRNGKRFLAATAKEAVFSPLYAEVDQAFRYKTRFRNRSGQNVGFAPQLCLPNSNQIPYCYDPPAIEAIRERVDCLLDLWRNHHDQLDATPGGARDRLEEYLCTSFAYAEACHPGMDTAVVHDGFERLFTELLVMMGDESYTRAFASRFDLANSNAVSFEGSRFEPGGINLSGVAGYEMVSLYQATQYYQEALDRFYALSPLMWESLAYGFDAYNFVTPETVTWYFDRLIRASTQKARAFSAVARRYQNFNRSDLARAVIERAYTATYIEGVVLARLMLTISKQLRPEDKPQVVAVLEDSQRRYRMALLDMRNVYTSITDNINFFGLPPDYIPFPTLNNREDNAFEVILFRARNKMEIAAKREDDALARDRAFETDTAEFQAELVRLRNTYENQLGDICGTFEGADRRIYPAVERYAYQSERTAELGDPCGMVGNGQLSTEMGQFEIAEVDLLRIRTQMENVLAEVEIERSRIEAQCNRIVDLADFVYDQTGKMHNLREQIRWMQFGISRIDRTLSTVTTLASLSKCENALGCTTAYIAIGAFWTAKIAGEASVAVLEGLITTKETEIDSIQKDTAYYQSLSECDAAMIDGNARMASILLRMKELELEALRAEYNVRLSLSDIERQYNLAKRLEQELTEAEQFAINIQAAKNDPNVRIYRNDAYLNADVSFEDAMREAYRATKVYEYYTSQSYADQEQLFLIRMVQFGDYNLQNYLTNLENAFYEFEDNYGTADTRVAIISLRDDILRIPRLDNDGRALEESERIAFLRARLTNAEFLDRNGYLTIPFSTGLAALSPLTRNHKVQYLEAEVIGSDIGDTMGRLYVRQQGTNVVHAIDGKRLYYRFPERTAVINPFFNGVRFFAPEVYRNYRLRDRPFVNTSWELVLNQRDELVNQDLNLASLNDVRLYVFYSDFTQF